MQVSLVTMALRAIALLTVDPRLGGGGMRREETAEMIELLAALIDAGAEAREELRKFAEEVGQMANDGVQPTARHFEALRERSARATAILEEAAARIDEDDASGGEQQTDLDLTQE